jgi:methylenetetrahydrofolate dehydrogenase (NADP+) / methenyltetrahydrofolate cyclohydrolase
MIINGRSLAKGINSHTAQRVKKLKFQPLLVDIVVGDDPASLSYVRIKEKKAREVELAFELHQLPIEATTEEVIARVQEISARKELCGLIIQLPLPAHLDSRAILNQIPSRVDVDLLNSNSSELFYSGQSALVPPTAAAILHILDSLPENWSSKQFVVLGQGELVGKPIAYLLKQRGLKVAVADSSTEDLDGLLRSADCIISGVGKPSLISGAQVKDSVIIIDAGTSEAGGALTGDVDFNSVEPKAKYITPVPGGVGPVTVSMLLANVVQVAEARS